MSGGALGALAGVALGALFDYGLKAVNTGEDRRTSGFMGGDDAWEQARQRQYYEGQRNSFLFSLLALQHHPDRVAALGDDIRRAAEKKFQEINEAKERIYKARGM